MKIEVRRANDYERLEEILLALRDLFGGSV